MPANPNSQTCLEIVSDAYRALRVLIEGEPTPNSDQTTLGFKELCGMLDQWRLEGWLTDNANGQLDFLITPNKADYTIGTSIPAADIPQVMPPAWISSIFLSDSVQAATGRTYPVQVCAPEEFWRASRATNTLSAYSLYATYLTDYPVSTLKFYPIPAVPIKCTLVFPEHIAVPTSISDTLALSPGFRNAIVYCLANVLSIYYPTDASDKVASAAAKYMQRIKDAKNIPVPSLMHDPAVSNSGTGGRLRAASGGLYNIRSNSFVGNF